jgi:hypothetical protein
MALWRSASPAAAPALDTQRRTHHDLRPMRYVMVPVPSEYVLDVMRMVLFRAPEDDEGSAMREEARLLRLMDEADDETRDLVLLVAKATIEDTPLRFADAADALELSPDALTDRLRSVNALALGGGRELIAISNEVAVRVHGNVGKNRYLVMRPEHARLLRAASAR